MEGPTSQGGTPHARRATKSSVDEVNRILREDGPQAIEAWRNWCRIHDPLNGRRTNTDATMDARRHPDEMVRGFLDGFYATGRDPDRWTRDNQAAIDRVWAARQTRSRSDRPTKCPRR